MTRHVSDRDVVVGSVKLLSSGALGGWCYSPIRKNDRLVVDIHINGSHIGSVTAARFVPELATKELGDGYHGFVFFFENQLNNIGILRVEAVERTTGLLIGRILSGRYTPDLALAARLNLIKHGVHKLRSEIPDLAQSSPARQILEQLGKTLINTHNNGSKVAAVHSERRPHTISMILVVDRPVVLEAQALRIFDSFAVEHGIELIAIDRSGTHCPIAALGSGSSFRYVSAGAQAFTQIFEYAVRTSFAPLLMFAGADSLFAKATPFRAIVDAVNQGSVYVQMQRDISMTEAECSTPRKSNNLVAMERSLYVLIGGLPSAYDLDKSIELFCATAETIGISVSRHFH